MYGIDELNTIIPILSKGLELMRSKPFDYDHNSSSPSASWCGTQCCTGGWIGVANGLRFTEAFTIVTLKHSPWRHYLFFGVAWDTTISRIKYGIKSLPSSLYHDGFYDTAIDRLTKYIDYLRRRLAIMEVEAGHWDDEAFLVGAQREEYLERELAAV